MLYHSLINSWLHQDSQYPLDAIQPLDLVQLSLIDRLYWFFTYTILLPALAVYSSRSNDTSQPAPIACDTTNLQGSHDHSLPSRLRKTEIVKYHDRKGPKARKSSTEYGGAEHREWAPGTRNERGGAR